MFLLPLLEARPAQGKKESLGRVPEPETEGIFVYGFGEGGPYEELEGWLQKDKKHQLIFLEEDLDVLLGWLQKKASQKILKNSQVHFFLLPKREMGETLFFEIASKWPLAFIEIHSLASKRRDRFHRLREGIFRWATALQGALYEQRVSHVLFSHFRENSKKLASSFYANRWQKEFSQVPAIICGAGPSLDAQLGALQQAKKKALLIGVGSGIKALEAKGIQPHLCLALDPNPEEFERLGSLPWTGVPLLYTTRLFPAVLEGYRGPVGYVKIKGMPFESWLNQELGLFEAEIGKNLSLEAGSVTPLAIALAHFFGCSPICLAGIDLAYAKGARYASGIEVPSGSGRSPQPGDRSLWRKNGEGEKVETAIRWVMESRAIGKWARNHRKTPVFNTSRQGLSIPGVRFASLEEILLENKEIDLEEKISFLVKQYPMPLKTGEIVKQKQQELQEALQRLEARLKILTRREKGSLPLAHWEWEQDPFSELFFPDLEKAFLSEGKIDWEEVYLLIEKYQ